MIFTLMGTELRDASYDSTTGNIYNETLTTVNELGENLAVASYRNVVCTVGTVTNSTEGPVIAPLNYTVTNCNLKYSGALATQGYNNSNWNVSYSYVYDADNYATNVMNDTGQSIASVTDWFDIFVVITAMVVLILLTVIIITAIRSSGMIAGAGSTSGANSVGTA